MPKPIIAPSLVAMLATLVLACSSGPTGPAAHRPSPPGDSCQDVVSCCLQRHPSVPKVCGLTASEAAVYLEGMAALAKEDEALAKDAGQGRTRQCADTYARCAEGRKGWKGDCLACLRRCEAEREWPHDLCYRQ